MENPQSIDNIQLERLTREPEQEFQFLSSQARNFQHPREEINNVIHREVHRTSRTFHNRFSQLPAWLFPVLFVRSRTYRGEFLRKRSVRIRFRATIQSKRRKASRRCWIVALLTLLSIVSGHFFSFAICFIDERLSSARHVEIIRFNWLLSSRFLACRPHSSSIYRTTFWRKTNQDRTRVRSWILLVRSRITRMLLSLHYYSVSLRTELCLPVSLPRLKYFMAKIKSYLTKFDMWHAILLDK